MSYPFVRAKWYSPGAIIEVRALVLHFAEGGGTVGYLQDPHDSQGIPVDVSAHFVVQYDGDIVQMVRDDDADHCQHVDRGTWSYAGDLNPANGRAVLGSEVMDNPDRTRVNRYVHAIEIEGFRKDGPNPKQTAALVELVRERRAKYPTIRGLLGHGDIQNKACPGKYIPWTTIGQHGLWQPEDPDIVHYFNSNGLLAADGRPLYRLPVTAADTYESADGKISGSFAGAYSPPILARADGQADLWFVLAMVRWGDGNLRLTPVLVKTSAAPIANPDATSDAAVNAALDHVAPAITAAQTALAEARPR